jgi:hypothetical protein
MEIKVNVHLSPTYYDTMHLDIYTHRVEVYSDALADDKVSKWLDENEIPYTKTGWGIYCMSKEHAAWLVLRWG